MKPFQLYWDIQAEDIVIFDGKFFLCRGQSSGYWYEYEEAFLFDQPRYVLLFQIKQQLNKEVI